MKAIKFILNCIKANQMKAGSGPKAFWRNKSTEQGSHVAGGENTSHIRTCMYTRARTSTNNIHGMANWLYTVSVTQSIVRQLRRKGNQGSSIDTNSSSAPYCDASALVPGLDGGYPIPWRVEGNTTKTTLATAPTTTGSATTTSFCLSLSDG